jgi:xanthine dehydrogenase YagT iron-sulfur-binding subunit
MAEDNAAPPEESRIPRARRLAEQALEAERGGDPDAAERLFAEAERIDPGAAADVLTEAARPAADRQAAAPRPRDRALRTAHPIGTAGSRAQPQHPTNLRITLRVNSETHRLGVDTRTTLLDALRDHLGLTGTKKGCALGQCGSCTVLFDGRRINACLMLAVMADGHAITTIEGLSGDGVLHPMQAAFIAHDAFQCGYCTPGQIMSAVGLLSEGHTRDEAEIREQMSGNLCRCGAYVNIVAAITEAREG